MTQHFIVLWILITGLKNNCRNVSGVLHWTREFFGSYIPVCLVCRESGRRNYQIGLKFGTNVHILSKISCMIMVMHYVLWTTFFYKTILLWLCFKKYNKNCVYTMKVPMSMIPIKKMIVQTAHIQECMKDCQCIAIYWQYFI